MRIDANSLDAEASYRLMTGVIVPRPIAWVTTISQSGVVNLAPFSHFTFVAPMPPMVCLSIASRGAEPKDTLRNILWSNELVVHIPHAGQVEQVHASAVEHPADVSEAEILDLATQPSEMVRPPRLVDARIAFECRVSQIVEVGATRNQLVIAEAVLIHVDDTVMRDGKLETPLVDPLCRLAGPNYAALGKFMTMKPIARTQKS